MQNGSVNRAECEHINIHLGTRTPSTMHTCFISKVWKNLKQDLHFKQGVIRFRQMDVNMLKVQQKRLELFLYIWFPRSQAVCADTKTSGQILMKPAGIYR